MSDDSSSDGNDVTPNRSSDDTAETTSDESRLAAVIRPLAAFLGDLIETNTDNPPPKEPTRRPAATDEPQRSPDRTLSSRPRTKRRRAARSKEHLVDTRREGEVFVVTADVSGTSLDDLSVGIDPRTNELVIAASGTVLERVEPPWPSVDATRVAFNNGILEVRLRPDG